VTRHDDALLELICEGIAAGALPLNADGDLVALYAWLLELRAQEDRHGAETRTTDHPSRRRRLAASGASHRGTKPGSSLAAR
jgi:hypothetical protein